MAKFQSAPRSRDRGDRKPATLARAIVVSIRAPVTRPGRQFLRCEKGHSGNSFNPRPGHATGATARLDATENLSRRFNPRPGHATGATMQPNAPHQPCGFQSAPRSRDRGDRIPKSTPGQSTSFNPRPGHATGATPNGWSIRNRGRGFNPRPGHATGATHV